jgi:hypothetical protein
MIPIETIPGIWGENDREGEFNYDVFNILLRTLVNATMYPQQTINKFFK